MPRDRDTDTEQDRRPNTSDEDRATMGNVSHTDPTTGTPFGETQAYDRGRVVVVDGGSAGERERTPMSRVDHTPRENAPAANEVYSRGGNADAE